MKRTTQINNQTEIPKELWESVAMDLYTAKNYIRVSRVLIKTLGANASLLLCHYLDKHNYFKEAFPGAKGWFFLTHDSITEEMGFSEYIIRNAKKELKTYKLIQTKMKGQPAKEYIKLNFKHIVELSSQPCKELGGLGLAVSGGSYNKTKDNILKKEKNILKKDKKRIIPFQEMLNQFPHEWKTNKEFSSILSDFIQFRKDINNPIRLASVQALINKLKRCPIDSSIEALQVSIENGWTGVFPKQNITPQGFDFQKKTIKLDPQLVVSNFFKEESLADAFIKDCYEPALELINEGDRGIIFDRLIQLYKYIDQEQDKHFDPLTRTTSFGPMDVVKEYLKWIGQNDWISDRSVRLFQPTSILFGKFRRYLANYDNQKRDPITGRSDYNH